VIGACRQAVRLLASAPTFYALCALCLGIGIGVNTMLFTLVNGVFLEALPFAESERLAIVNEARRDNPSEEALVSYPTFLEWAEGADGVVELAAARTVGRVVSDGEMPEWYPGPLVSWKWFSVLGVQPVLGRSFGDADDEQGAPAVVLLEETLWEQRYARDPEIIGRSLVIDGRPHTIVGVMPNFTHPVLPAWLRSARLWTPLAPVASASGGDDRSLRVLGRLAAGVEPEAAAGRLGAIGLARETGDTDDAQWAPRFRGLAVAISPINRASLIVMLGAAACMLLIACANVANLMLARASRRRREIAIRSAVGASRGRIVRQLLSESLMVGLLCAPIGLLLAFWGIELVRAAGPPEVTYLLLPMDVRVLAFTLALAILTSLMFGLAPALHAVRSGSRDALHEGGRDATVGGAANKRLRNSLIVAEVALSVVLLIGASLFVHSFLNLLSVDDSFDTSQLMTLSIQMPERYDSPDARMRLVNEVLAHIDALPGVESNVVSSVMPLRGASHRGIAVVEGTQAAASDRVGILYGGVTARFFATLDVPLVRGRELTDAEARTRSAVAVVNERMAERFWAGDALGQRFRLDGDSTGVWFTVIGVSRNLSNWNHSDRPLPTAYLPYSHVPVNDPSILVRVEGDPMLAMGSVRAAVAAVDPAVPAFALSTMEDVHRQSFWRQELVGVVLSAFGAVAAFLAAAGVYGVLSYLVSLRTREIGVRMALGAQYRDVVWLIARQGMRLVLIGVALGLACSALLMQVVRVPLFEVEPLDPLTFAGVAVFLAAVGFVASYPPAYRAAMVDPVISLRD
jgi:putative ABC transport system permease protein